MQAWMHDGSGKNGDFHITLISNPMEVYFFPIQRIRVRIRAKGKVLHIGNFKNPVFRR
jgi:hypothetical protein